MTLFIGNNDATNNPTLFTPWTIVHIASSSSLYAFFIMFVKHIHSVYIAIFIHSLYELKDYYYSYINIKYTGRDSNSCLNSIGDTLGCFVGIYLSYKLNIYLSHKSNIYLSHNSNTHLIITCIITLIAFFTCCYLNYD